MNYHQKGQYYETKKFPIDNKQHDCTEKEKEKEKEREREHEKEKNHEKDEQVCVEEVLEAILKAQRKVEKDYQKKCSSCKESIEELLEEPKKPRKNTIPFILYCGCEPFKASGVTTHGKGPKDKKLACVSSYIFKIKDLKGACAELELLTFNSKNKCNDTNENNQDGKKGLHQHDFSLCDQIDHEKVEDLQETGVCINVDLSCFCSITCLPAVRL
ncbi:CotY/CotZ family spore coat protein [Niallia sp. XMNu-256]|uniref:CotY/CotZ family spore coat protein n=1 Tax=Niallia sp. XMNu-256 TaxID=3082444 RepID=UPI0030CFCF4C